MRKTLFSLVSLLLLPMALWGQTVKGDWHGVLNAGGAKLNIVFHFKEGNGYWTMDSPDQSVNDIPVLLVKNRNDSVALEVPMIKARYDGVLAEGKLKGTFTQMGMALELCLEPGVIERKRPQTPQPPFPYTTQELSFTGSDDGATLCGTLTMPAGRACNKLVVMVSGSGQQNRDEELFGHKPFAVMADRLARRGIASFRYDDRGVGKSQGMRPDLTTAHFAADALCAVKMLRGETPCSKIGIMGHSEGGLIAFMLAGNHPADISFIVSLAGPALTGEKVLRKQAAEIGRLMTGTEMDEGQIDQSVNMMRKQPWGAYFLDYDPAADISKITCPVFAANGAKDLQVDATDNIGMLKQTLKIKPVDKIVVYDGLNHLFQHAPTGLPTEYNGIEETISEQVMTEIGEWINGL